MRKIKLFIACSLDGFIAREDGGVDWLFTDADYGFKKFFSSIDTMLMGRKTYEKGIELGDRPDKGKKWYVFSRRKEKKEKTLEFVKYSSGFVKKLLRSKGKDMWLVGGSEIISLFIKDALLDEIIVYVHPIILGNGIPLFKKNDTEMKLRLVGTTPYKSGLVGLHYKLLKK